jgi:(p)ppGpp synthase/HD superfamily hydrolase
MNIKKEIAVAKSIAEEAHKDDKRRGGAPYMEHVNAVVAGTVSERAKPAAYVHDVMEDHPERYNEIVLLERGLSEETVRAATLLNKNVHSDMSYEDYIRLVKTNPIAREVKLSDIRHNLSDSPSEKQILKYEKALQILIV